MPTEFIYNNISKKFTPAATSTITGFPATNLNTYDFNRVWRAAKATNVYVTFSGTTLYTFNSIFLFNTNLSATPGAGESLSVQFSQNDFSTYTTYSMNRRTVNRYVMNGNSIDTVPTTVNYYCTASPFQFKQFRILINMNTSHPYTYYQVGEVMMFNLETSFNYGGIKSGFDFGNKIDEVAVKNQYGSSFPILKTIKKEGTFSLKLTPAELTNIESLAFYSQCIFFPSGKGALSNLNDFIPGYVSYDNVTKNQFFSGQFLDKELQIKFTEMF